MQKMAFADLQVSVILMDRLVHDIFSTLRVKETFCIMRARIQKFQVDHLFGMQF